MFRRAATLAVALSLCTGLLPAATLGVAPGFSPGSPGVGDPYFPLDGNGGYNVQRYLLNVRYNPATNVLRGVAEIRARAKKNLSKFNLDLDGLTVRSITVDGRQATWRRKGGELTVTPKLGLLDHKDFVVVINYDGVPKTLNDLFGVSGFIHTDDGALVVGEPHVAATWFPVNDHPIDKAAYTFQITVPAGLEAIANGVLQGQSTNQGWTTWRWVADEPMASYLAGMAIGQFDVHAYAADGIKYWDAIDPDLFLDLVPPVVPKAGEQFLFSDVGEPAYKRLTRIIDVPAGGAQLSFQVNRDTEGAFDFVFVEARTPAGSDWTTLPDENGHTSQDVGACPGFLGANPFLDHYLTPFLVDPGDPNDPFDDFYSCNPVGSSGVWHAASGMSDPTVNDGWEAWSIQLENTGTTPKQVEVSITYASDEAFQGRGVVIDDIIVSTGQGTTSFEADADPLDGWVVAADVPEGSAPNPNSWTIATLVPGVPGPGVNAQASFARQPEIIAFEAGIFGPYPFSAAGGIVDDEPIFFALENQTRPIYSPFFFFDPVGGDFVIVHELAHQWFGDSLAVERWQHIWLNEGFATYAEWLWSEREGFGTADEIFGFYSGIPADDPFWSLRIGDPGRKHLFDFPVYGRGAMTLHALRLEVGDTDFFEILRRWVSTQAGGNVTTDEFISLAERISGENLDGLFKAWLFSAEKPPDLGAAASRQATTKLSLRDAPAEVRSLAERLRSHSELPFSD